MSKPQPNPNEPTEFERFKELAAKLLAVPKKEIAGKDKKKSKKAKKRNPSKK